MGTQLDTTTPEEAAQAIIARGEQERQSMASLRDHISARQTVAGVVEAARFEQNGG